MLAKIDEATGKPLVDVILDAAEQKGTGRWTAQNALELGVPLTGITEAVFARTLSALKDRARGRRRAAGRAERVAATTATSWPTTSSTRCTRPRSSPTRRASPRWRPRADDEGWNVDLGAMATIWRGGCIIRARFLDRIREAYDDEPDLANLMLADFFADALEEAQDPWRRVVARAAELGIPTPAFSSSLAYYDGYRRARGPASLIQGLRDLFGAHTYRRIDRDGHVPHALGRRRARGRGVSSAGSLSELATEAFIYGFPLVFDLQEVDRIVRQGLGSVPPTRLNRFGHAASLAGPEDKFVSINNDTVYSIANVDVGGGLEAGREQMEQALRHSSTPKQNGWDLTYHAFDYNLDFFEVGALDSDQWKLPDGPGRYLRRALAARGGLWGNHGYEAAYAAVYDDADGQPLDGSRRYERRRAAVRRVLVGDDVRRARLLSGRQPARALLDRRPYAGPAARCRRTADDRAAARRAVRARAEGRAGCPRPRASSGHCCGCTSRTTRCSTAGLSCRRSGAPADGRGAPCPVVSTR